MITLTKAARSVVDPMRRRLLTGATSPLLFVPLVARALCFTSRLPDIPAASDSGGDQGDSRIEAAADDAMLLTVGVELNGNGPYAFVVDTGADRTVIADDLVEARGMVRGARVLVEGIIRGTAADTALVSRMRLGSTERRCYSSLFAALKNRNATQSTTGTVALSGVTNGRVEGTLTSVDKIQLKELILTPMLARDRGLRIFKLWGLSHTPALLIGMNLLRAFARVSIDYRRKEISFELTKSRVPEVPVYAQSQTRIVSHSRG